MAMFPFGMLPIEFAEFRNGGVEIAFVTVRVSKIVTDGASLGALRFAF